MTFDQKFSLRLERQVTSWLLAREKELKGIEMKLCGEDRLVAMECAVETDPAGGKT